MRPAVGRTSVLMQPSVVLLPAPFGPSRPKNSPAWTAKDTPRTASTGGVLRVPAYVFRRSSTTRMLIATEGRAMLPRAPRPPRSGSARARAPPGRPGGRAAGRRGGSHASAARHLAPRPAPRRHRARPRRAARSTRRAGRGRSCAGPSPCRASQLAKAFAASQRPTGRRRPAQPSSTIAAARSRPNAATRGTGTLGPGVPPSGPPPPRAPSRRAPRRGGPRPRVLVRSCARSRAPRSRRRGPASAVHARSASASAPSTGEGLPDRQPLAAQHRDRVLLRGARAPPSSSARRGAAAAAARRVRPAPRRATTPESAGGSLTTASATSSRNSSAAAVGQ